MLQVHDVPLAGQTTCGRNQVGCGVTFAINGQDVGTISDREILVSSNSSGSIASIAVCVTQISGSIQHCRAARCFAVDVLGGFEQTIGAVGSGRNVGHVQDFNIAFAGLGSFVGSSPVGTGQTIGNEVFTGCRQSRQRAGVVHGQQVSQTSCGVLGNDTGPDVARGHEDLEVQHVVRVGSATEAHLHSLAVGGIGVGQVEHRQVTLLGRVVRHQQNVTCAAFGHRQGSRSCTCKTQAANQGGNAQGQNVLFHKNFSSKKTR